MRIIRRNKQEYSQLVNVIEENPSRAETNRFDFVFSFLKETTKLENFKIILKNAGRKWWLFWISRRIHELQDELVQLQERQKQLEQKVAF